MGRTASILLLAGAVWMAAAAPLAAHHSISAEFDTNKPISFKGTIKKVEWMNPHIYTHVEVKNPDGTHTVYRVEGGPPNSLYRQGWRKDTLKVGDVVSVTGVRAKIATSMNVGQATITTSDGKRVFAQGGGGRAAAARTQDAPAAR
jgi:DNA/RNA endonuclease YhcR with UshA esterase domain